MIRVNTNLKSIEGYKPSDRGNEEVAKLDWNECNLPIDEKYYSILRSAIASINFTEYPNINHERLINKLAAYCRLSADQIQIFNGSDSALSYVFTTFLNPDTKVLIFYPHYSQVETYIKVFTDNINYSNIVDVFGAHTYSTSDIEQNDVIYLSNPNNPTGHFLDAKIVEGLLSKYPDKLFIIDEAYYEFCGYSCVHLVKEHKNIIVSRTFSKAFSLASARLGYICCNKELLHHIDKIRNTKEVNSFAQALGEAALDNFSYIQDRVDLVNENMSIFKTGLKELQVDFVDSKANFVLIKIAEVGKLIKKLKEYKILVRDRSSFAGLENCVRISIGTKEEMGKILAVIKEHKSQFQNGN
ncbi:histidinol-phosphate transaminase [Flavipsychrobacter stenotrophus]|uniref:histidinol-phosphate transaminase n=1 Tax=Flavipsychrobacter stenotrophus TaxID=2077091 RepID=A0A2S7SYE4_9BACT|nr:histidinol-phosphate transaminase [Flavipsychrobacter stenotrophus]PQJ11641.1 histidinol-phosphate transaminase [Flavipsychrobacter stenotrophus]